MDKVELRNKIHQITVLFAGRIVGEASKRNLNAFVIMGFNKEADDELIALFDEVEIKEK